MDKADAPYFSLIHSLKKVLYLYTALRQTTGVIAKQGMRHTPNLGWPNLIFVQTDASLFLADSVILPLGGSIKF